MAAGSVRADIDVSKLTGEFDLDVVKKCNLLSLSRFVLSSFEDTFNFCAQLRLIRSSNKCNSCRKELKLGKDTRGGHEGVVFRCNNKHCSVSYRSVRKDSFFDGAHLSLQQIILFAYLFTSKITSYTQLQHECRLSPSDEELSRSTIADWLSFCREVCLETVARHTPTLIGGPGKTVEVDESKFGKRKYHKGRHVEGQWVVGGICRETGDIFLAECPGNKRDAATLVDIIERHVAKTSTVVTDCWRGYGSLDRDGWHHLTVNHEYNFVGKNEYC